MAEGTLLTVVVMADGPGRAAGSTLAALRHQASRCFARVEVLPGDGAGGWQPLSDTARGAYIAWLPGDAVLSDDFLSVVTSTLRFGPPVLVTFDVTEVSETGNAVWRLDHHVRKRRRGLAPINHCCVWRRDLAARVAWPEFSGPGAEQLWSKPQSLLGVPPGLRVSHIRRSILRVPGNKRLSSAATRMVFRVYLSKHDECLISDEDGHDSMILCRDPRNAQVSVPRRSLRYLGNIEVTP